MTGSALIALGVALTHSGLYLVPTGSMLPTLGVGDVIWCWRTNPSRIERGDVIVFDAPNTGEKGIKRLVGLPTDSIVYMGKQLTIDGRVAVKRVKRELLDTDSADLLLEQTLFRRSFEVVELYGQSLSETDSRAGPGYFLLGDNRDASVDSRHYGRLAEDRIECKALAVVATESGRFISLGFRWL